MTSEAPGRTGVASRRAALEVLVAVAGGARSDRSLDGVLRRSGPSDADRRLITEIVYGTLRRRRTLDRTLQPYCRTPWRRLDASTREALRMGAYQVGYLRSVPPHAAVHATVGALGPEQRGAAGMVNAVLRAWLRDGGELHAGDGGLADRLDLPPWLLERWVERYGSERATRWFEAALRPAPLTLRVHAGVIGGDEVVAALRAAGVEVEAAGWSSRVLRVVSGRPLALEAVRQGRLTLRGEAGQIVAALLPKGGARVLDTCAGRGGKSVQLSEEHPDARVVAADRRPELLRRCARAGREAGVEGIRAVAADMAGFAPFRRRFDRILVDAPCSGVGTIRRHPEIRWRVRRARLRQLRTLQRRILTQAIDLLATGGRLLYTTCSTEPEENEQVVERILEVNPGVTLVPIRPPAGLEHLVAGDGMFRTYPEEPELDGFFAAQLGR